MIKAIINVGVAVICMLGSGLASASPLQISLNTGERAGEVQVSLTNTGANPVSVLRWDTPFEETLSHPVFMIQSPQKGYPFNSAATYTGRVVKRSVATEDSYLLIESGETVFANVVLNDYYDIQKFGLYGVQFFGDIRFKELIGLAARQKVDPSDIDVLTHSHVHSNTMKMALQPKLTPRLRPPEYGRCSIQEQDDIVEAANIAERLTRTALTDLRSVAANERANSPRYTTWFGEYTAARYNRVISNFEAVQNTLSSETLQFNCDCDEPGIYAFVYPAFPYSITLCPEFRNARPDGENSRAGTIIHEISHFTVVADTDDHAYSHQGTQALANSSPDLAVANADSHEYFSENDPALPIRRANDDPNQTQATTLQLETPVQVSVAAGERNNYQVSGARRVTLESLSGDVDLYVYRDAQLSVEICRSQQQGNLDVCEFFSSGTVYIQVVGFDAASYSIIATNDSDVSDDSIFALQQGVSVNGSVAQARQVIYEISGVDVVELQSLSGDADLYIFNNKEFSSSSLICSSVETASEATLDRCNIPPTDFTYYISVYGYSDATYSIIARSTSITNITRLAIGQTVSRSIEQGGFDYYVVSGANSVTLTSTSGDADLLLTNDSNFVQNSTSCVSETSRANSIVDQCPIPSTSEHYILVRGFTNADYSIVAEGVTPSDDDPNSTTTSVGGGVMGMIAILCLLLSSSIRVRVRG